MSALLCGVVVLQSMPAPLLFAQPPAGEGAACAGSPLPVDLRSGELLLVAPDLKVGLSPLSLELTRVYRSSMEQAGPGVFGHRWHCLLDMRVVESDGNLSLLDEAGRLRTYRPQPDGSWVSEKYDHERIRKTADAGFVRSLKSGLEYQFDASARLSEIRDPNGRFIRISRSDTASASVRLEDRIGRFITLELNGEGQATRAVDSAGRACLYGYDEAGNLTTCQNRGGGVLQMRYDANHRLTQLDGGPLAYTIAYRDGRICRQETDRGRIASYVYAEQGDARTVAVTDAAGAETLHSFAKGGELTVTDPTGVKESIWLNDRDLPVKVFGADGRTVTIAYDDHANVVSVDDGGAQTRLTYGPDDSLREMRASTGESATLSYDGRRNVTMQEDARGARTRFTWDQQGQLVGVRGPAGEALALTYDDNGHVRTLTTADGQRVTFDFTLVGILRGVTTPTGVQIGYRYDPLDRLTGVENSEGQQAHLVRDPWGQVIKVVDPAGNASTMEYDAAGLLTAVQDPLGAVTRLAYDPLGRPTSLTDANANVTQWNYDAAGRVLGEVDALGKPRVARYNERGQLQAQTNRRGQTTTLTYDGQGRLVATDAAGDPATFAYDQTGRLVGMKDGDSDYRLAFTADGLLRTVADGVAGVPVSYEYDAVGRRVTMTAGKDVVHYAYDAYGRLSTIQGSVGTVTLAYDPFGRRSAMRYPNGVTTTYAYDKLNRLTELQAVGRDGEPLARYRYAYDLAGNRTRMIEGEDKVTQYAYDALGRLTTVTEGTNVTAYAYDPVGNRIAVSANGVNEDYATGKDNQLLKAGGASFDYDADGNMVSRTTAEGKRYTYRYDAANRLIEASGPDGTATYGYAPNGARVSRAETGQPATRFLFDQEDMIAEFTGNAPAATYLHGPGIDEPLAQRRGDGTVFYQADGLGSITGLTDDKGAPAGQYTYDAFGQPRQDESKVVNPYRYTGREWDATADSYFYRARFYMPDVGRFSAQDPLGLTQGPNQYAYCVNNPTTYSDPSGAFLPLVPIAVGAVVGGVIGGVTYTAQHLDWSGFSLLHPGSWGTISLDNTSSMNDFLLYTAGGALAGAAVPCAVAISAYVALPGWASVIFSLEAKIAGDIGNVYLRSFADDDQVGSRDVCVTMALSILTFGTGKLITNVFDLVAPSGANPTHLLTMLIGKETRQILRNTITTTLGGMLTKFMVHPTAVSGSGRQDGSVVPSPITTAAGLRGAVASTIDTDPSGPSLPAPEDDDSLSSGDVPMCVVPVKPSAPPPGRAGVQ